MRPLRRTSLPAALCASVLCASVQLLGPSVARAAADADELLPPWASELAEVPEARNKAVQQRKYELAHEMSLLVGGLPVDPYFKALTATVGYTLHLNNFIAWQLGSLTYSYVLPTNFRTEITQRLNTPAILTAPRMPAVKGFAASHLVIKPIYGKQAFRDYTLIHLEAYAQVGPALVWVNSLSQDEIQVFGDSFTVGLDWGLGIRLWLSPTVSLRGEMGQVLYFIGGATAQSIHFQGGVAINLGSDG
jgi:hypothetical protein